MKKLGLYFSLLAICLFSFRTEEIDIYSVIRVIGSITHTNNGKALYTGDKVRSNEKLKFRTQQSKAAVISRRKGRFILSASVNNKKLGLMPAMNNISSRAGALINSLDLKKHFEGKYLIMDGYEVEIGDKSYPMNANNFFFLRFDYNGEAISKKLNFEGNKLHMTEDEIMKVDEKSITLPEDAEMKLFYRDNAQNSSTEIAVFTPIFADNEILKMEVGIILDEYSDADSKTKVEEVTSYLNENYGKPHKDNLTTWLKANFNVE